MSVILFPGRQKTDTRLYHGSFNWYDHVKWSDFILDIAYIIEYKI